MPTLRSRVSLAVMTIVLLAGAVPAPAQQDTTSVTIGVLSGQSREWRYAAFEAFRRELRELGWEDGKNLTIEERFAGGDAAQLPVLAEDLVRRKVAVILAATSVATRAAMRTTKTIPIVMVDVGDPVATKLVTNLARPGGNITGFTNMVLGLTQKRLALLKETLPNASRIAMLSHPDNLIGPPQWRDAEVAARRLGLRIQRLEIRTRDDLRRAFEAAAKARADAVVPLADPLTTVLTRDILELAAKYRLPAMMEDRERVEAGALLSYNQDPREAYRRAASYVDRILRGAVPGDLPVEQPTNLELVVNLKTAKTLGLTIPPAVLLQATGVIE
jgi:putative tryptophan/tyrosine transport system substrate-binding protein